MTPLREKAFYAKIQYQLGRISVEEAKSQINPYLDYVNEKGKDIAKRCGVRHRNIHFTSFVR
jgi:hypothetical protein